MSALDQALIRVYTQQPPPTAAAPHEGLRAVPLAEALADPPRPEDQRAALTPETVMDVLAQPAPKLPEVPPATSEIALPPGSNELTEPQPPVPHFVKPKPAKRKSSKAAPTLEDLQMPDLIYRVDAAAVAAQGSSGGAGTSPVPHLHIASSGLAAMGSAPAGTVTADTATSTPASNPGPAAAWPSEQRGPKPPAEKSTPAAEQRSGAVASATAVSSAAVGGAASAPQAPFAVQAPTAAQQPAVQQSAAAAVPDVAGAPVASVAEPQVPSPHYAIPRVSDGQATVASLHSAAAEPSWAAEAASVPSGGPSVGFALPEICNRLLVNASEQVDRLCDALASARLQGRQVIALAAYRRNEGTTTVVLCAAQRLAERGLRIAVVEADPTHGQLAKTLGLEARYGWNAALAGRLPLESVLIQSPGGRLSVLPWTGSEAVTLDGMPDAAVVGEHLSRLAAGHHIVLLDCAALEEQGTTNGLLVRCVGKRLDGLVVIHNPNFTSRERIAEVQRRLAAAGLFAIGIVQNLARKR